MSNEYETSSCNDLRRLKEVLRLLGFMALKILCSENLKLGKPEIYLGSPLGLCFASRSSRLQAMLSKIQCKHAGHTNDEEPPNVL